MESNDDAAVYDNDDNDDGGGDYDDDSVMMIKHKQFQPTSLSLFSLTPFVFLPVDLVHIPIPVSVSLPSFSQPQYIHLSFSLVFLTICPSFCLPL